MPHQQQKTSCSYRDDISKKDQGRAFLNRGSTLPRLDEDGSTIMCMATQVARDDDGTNRTPSR
jgi:hypothetical protein